MALMAKNPRNCAIWTDNSRDGGISILFNGRRDIYGPYEVIAEQIAAITFIEITPPHPLHEVNRPWLVRQLAEDMRTNGWVGAPVITISQTQAITGVHRIAASAAIGLLVPRVRIFDLCYELGINWSSLVMQHGSWREAVYLLPQNDSIPPEVFGYLGWDVDVA